MARLSCKLRLIVRNGFALNLSIFSRFELALSPKAIKAAYGKPKYYQFRANNFQRSLAGILI